MHSPETETITGRDTADGDRVEARAGVALGVRARTALSVVVFCAGAGSMATEICASRLLAPYYGGSTVVWANVIGLVLASLSLGYWLGGRLADRGRRRARSER